VDEKQWYNRGDGNYMATKQKQTIPVKLTISEEAYLRLTGTLTDKSEYMTSEVLSNTASQLLQKYADGGIILDSVSLSEIEKVTGKPVTTAREVVTYVEKAVGRQEGSYDLTVSVDPALIEPMIQRATEMGLDSPKDLLNEVVNTALTNGWAFNLTPMGGSLHFNEEGWAKVRELLGKNSPLGADFIAKYDRKRTVAA
jgi:hypothetical protein